VSLSIVIDGDLFHVEHFTCGVILAVLVCWWCWKRPSRRKP
jgi:hypothetical protein